MKKPALKIDTVIFIGLSIHVNWRVVVFLCHFLVDLMIIIDHHSDLCNPKQRHLERNEGIGSVIRT
jgi:hypothetical protein